MVTEQTYNSAMSPTEGSFHSSLSSAVSTAFQVVHLTMQVGSRTVNKLYNLLSFPYAAHGHQQSISSAIPNLFYSHLIRTRSWIFICSSFVQTIWFITPLPQVAKPSLSTLFSCATNFTALCDGTIDVSTTGLFASNRTSFLKELSRCNTTRLC